MILFVWIFEGFGKYPHTSLKYGFIARPKTTTRTVDFYVWQTHAEKKYTCKGEAVLIYSSHEVTVQVYFRSSRVPSTVW